MGGYPQKKACPRKTSKAPTVKAATVNMMAWGAATPRHCRLASITPMSSRLRKPRFCQMVSRAGCRAEDDGDGGQGQPQSRHTPRSASPLTSTGKGARTPDQQVSQGIHLGPQEP